MTAFRFPLRELIVVAMQQLGLTALLSLLLLVWLHIPDANVFEVLCSLVLALLVAAVAGAGESLIALRLTKRVVTVRRVLAGSAAVLVAALLWYAVSLGLEKLSGNDLQYAGYLNSRFPSSLRNVFSYQHIATWLGWLWIALRWISAGLLAAFAFAVAACDTPVRRWRTILGFLPYWLALLLLLLVAENTTGLLMNWTPGHGLAVETLSLVLRMLLAIVLNALAAGMVFVAMAIAVRQDQSAGGGEPEISHPRTADTP